VPVGLASHLQYLRAQSHADATQNVSADLNDEIVRELHQRAHAKTVAFNPVDDMFGSEIDLIEGVRQHGHLTHGGSSPSLILLVLTLSRFGDLAASAHERQHPADLGGH
jgi:hypothetical protein